MRERNFRELIESLWSWGHFLCVGLDSDLSRIPESVHAGGVSERLLVFNRWIIDPLRDVLRWRNAEGFPVLAPFTPWNNEFSLSVRSQNSEYYPREAKPGLPAPICDCYDDVFALLESRRTRNRSELRATVRFSGAIPQDVRQTIQRVQQQMSDIRILAGVDRWQLEEHDLPALREDPIVIGYDGQEFWLLATFDLTPLEEAVRQICSGGLPGRV